MTLSTNSLTLLYLIPWAVLWLMGGLWLVRAAFRLQPHEEWLVGFALGWVFQNWLANLLAWFVPTPVEFWVSAVLIFLVGAAAARRGGRNSFKVSFSAWQILVLSLLLVVHFSISRGLAIFDDYAHLPTVSIMAAGDIPPHFSFDPEVLYGYHHFLLLFSAQLMRIGGMTPWAAIDAGRTLAFGTTVMLAYLFARRLTLSHLGGLAGGLMMAFGSGTRWLLMLLPPGLVVRLTQTVEMLGSGVGSGPTLQAALSNTWAVEGAGPLGFPFAFANGIYPAGIISSFYANGLLPFANILLLLLTFNRWRGWLGAVLSAVLISVWGLLGEAELVAIIAGWGAVALVYIIQHRSLRLPRGLLTWLGVIAAGSLVGFLEGGAWTDMLGKAFVRLTGGSAAASYQTVGFTLAPPAIVSSHLGVLSMFDPRELLVGLAEMGPVLLVFPLLVIFGLKAYRAGRWYEAATAATALVMILTIFVQFTGSTGVRNTSRLYVFMPLLAVFAVPLVWMWVRRRAAWLQGAAAGLGVVMMLGGVVMLGAAMTAIQRPVYSYFITQLDVQMTRAYWNKLEPGALIFDPDPSRGTTVLGRHTNSSYTWYHAKPEWQALRDTPDPSALRAAGFRYLYLDQDYWDEIGLGGQQALTSACVTTIAEYADGEGRFRRLLDLEGCR